MVMIKKVRGRQVFDSRGNPTVEVDVVLKGRGGQDILGRAIDPSGASTGKHEALELRDGGRAYFGKGVTKAVGHVNGLISRKLRGKKFGSVKEVDELLLSLDGSPDKSRLGANALLGVSLAFTRALAVAKGKKLYELLFDMVGDSGKKGSGKVEGGGRGRKRGMGRKLGVLPLPFCNVINGGKHATNGLALQEFMIVPKKIKSFSEGVRIVSEIDHVLKERIKKKYGGVSTGVGDEGGFAPAIKTAREALTLLSKATEEAGYGKKIGFALDAAASEFYDGRRRKYLLEGKKLSAEGLLGYYEKLVGAYPIVSLEDPFDQDDFHAFSLITKRMGKKVQIVGDDLLVTNPDRIGCGVANRWCNALLLKVNQIGTLSEALAAAGLASRAGWGVMVSHRSGETEDAFISDLAVGLGCGQIKIGAPCRSERVAKYNQLLRIEEELGRKARVAKW